LKVAKVCPAQSQLSFLEKTAAVFPVRVPLCQMKVLHTGCLCSFFDFGRKLLSVWANRVVVFKHAVKNGTLPLAKMW
jgi:hypothetical protein